MNWSRRLIGLMLTWRDEVIADRAREASSLRRKLSRARREQARLAGQLATVLEERRRLAGQLEGKQASLTESRELLSQARAREATLEGHLGRSQHDAQHQRTRREVLAKRVQGYRHLRHESEALRRHYEDRIGELLRQARAREATLEAHLRRSQQDAQHQRARREVLVNQVQRDRQLRHDYRALRRYCDDRVGELVRAVDSAEQGRQHLAEELTLREQTVVVLRSRLSEMATVKEALDGDVLRLEGLLQEKDKALAAAEEARTKLVQSLESALADKRAQQDVIAQLTTQAEESRLENERLGSALEAEASVIAHQQSDLDATQVELTSARRWIAAVSRLEDVIGEEAGAGTGLLKAAAELLTFERGTLAVMDSGRNELLIKAVSNGQMEPGAMLRLRRGQGLAGWSVEHQQPLLVRDSRLDNRFIASSSDNSAASYLTVPLIFDSGGPEVLTLSRSIDDPFSDADLHAALDLCRHAEQKLGQARLRASLRFRGTLLEELQGTIRDLLSANDRQELVNRILLAACKTGEGAAALLALHDSKTFVLEPTGSIGLPDGMEFNRLEWGAPVATMASKSGDPWVISIEDALPRQMAATARAAGIETLISIPCQTAPLLCEVRDGLLIRQTDLLGRQQADEVRGVLNVYLKTTASVPYERIEQLQLLASYGVAALKAVSECDRMKRELRVASSLSTHLLGRERHIEQLQARMRELEETLSV